MTGTGPRTKDLLCHAVQAAKGRARHTVGWIIWILRFLKLMFVRTYTQRESVSLHVAHKATHKLQACAARRNKPFLSAAFVRAPGRSAIPQSLTMHNSLWGYTCRASGCVRGTNAHTTSHQVIAFVSLGGGTSRTMQAPASSNLSSSSWHRRRRPSVVLLQT